MTLPRGMTEERRFLERLIIGDGCWGWSGGCLGFGYGQFTRQGRKVGMTAHRAAYEMFVGPIPAGMSVLHRCDNPPCTRLDHLFLGTAADNMADKVAKGRQARGIPMGDHSGERNGGSKLTAAQVRAILRRRQSGERQDRLAAEYGVSTMTLRRIEHGRSWLKLGVR